MDKLINFLSDKLSYIIIEGCSRFFKIIFIPLLAFIIDLDTYGEFSYLYSLLIFFTLFTGFNIPLYFRHLFLKFNKKIGKFFLVTIFVLIVTTTLYIFLVIIFKVDKILIYLLLVSIHLNLINGYNSFILGLNDKILYLKENLIMNFSFYGIILIWIFFDNNNITSLILFKRFSIIGSILSLYIFLRLFFGFSLDWSLPKLKDFKYLFNKSTALIFTAFCGVGIIYIDRIFLKVYHGEIMTGNYTYIYSFFMIYNLIIIAFTNRFIPNLYRILKSSENHLSSINYYNENKNSIIPYVFISPLIFAFGYYFHLFIDLERFIF